MTSSSARPQPGSARSALSLAEENIALRAENAELKRRLAEAERLADRDTLTPLLNRRAFLREMSRAIALARRHTIPASVVYLDLDGFKSVNDRYGHAAGDATLVAVAERLLGAVRASDVVGRLGGDEFAVLLLHADIDAAKAKAETLAQAISGRPVAVEGVRFDVGITWGAREIGGEDVPERALAEADAVMYLRKPAKH